MVHLLSAYFQLQDVNIILTADHGMIDVKEYINLDLYVSPDLYDFQGSSSSPMIKPFNGMCIMCMPLKLIQTSQTC